MSFNFGGPRGTNNLFSTNSTSSTQPSSGGLFGGTSNPGTTASFGQAATTTAPIAGGLFGNTLSAPGQTFGGTTSASTPPAIFGAAASNTNSGTSTPFFGAGSGPLAGGAGGMFGNKSAAATSAPASNPFGATSGAPLFGGLGSFGQSAKKDEGTSAANKGQSSSQAPPLFSGFNNSGSALSFGASSAPVGSTTPAPSKFTLGNSTTPAGPPPMEQGKPPGSSLFSGLGGQQNPSSNLFSNLKASDPSSSSTPKPLFSSAGNTTSSAFGSGNPSGGTGLFSILNQSTPASSGTSAAGTTSTSSETPKPPAFNFNTGTPTSTPNTQALSNLAAPSSLFNAGAGAGAGASGSSTSGPSNTLASTAPVSTPSLFSTANTSSAASKPSLFSGLGGGLGGLGGASTATTTLGTTAPGTTAPAAASLFPNTTKSTISPTTTSMPAPAPGAPGTSNNAQSTTNPAFGASTMGPPPSLTRLKNKTMDEIITRWASDLSKYQKDFQEQAMKVAAWDRLMVDNGEKIQKLFNTTHEAQKQASEIEKQLTNVENNQAELESWLDRYEADVDEMFSRQVGQGDTLQGPDQERERTYKLAEKLTDRLNDMGNNLTSMIEAINEASSTLSKTSKADDPLSHIVRVLNSHLTQLQWIDENATALQTKVAEAQKMGQSFGLNGYGGPESDAAESFYRSFTGRR